MRRILLAVAAVAIVAVGGSAAPASAGGANLFPVQDRYEPGDIATLVGYVSPSSAGGWIADAPYSTFAVSRSGERVRLGTVAFEPATGAASGGGTLRVTLTFQGPDD